MQDICINSISVLTACICTCIPIATVHGHGGIATNRHIDAYSGATGPTDPFCTSDFDIDDIKNWTGEGDKRAAIAFQWSDDRQEVLEVYGYRWYGFATGYDMLKAVVESNPHLYCLVQQTVLPSEGATGSFTLCGAGYHTGSDTSPALIDPASGENISAPHGLFLHPRGIGHDGINVDYDYDEWKSACEEDIWESGWFTAGHWIYWTRDPDWNLHYSGTGMCGRILLDNSWDLWAFASTDIGWEEWKPFVAAEAVSKESNVTVQTHTDSGPTEQSFTLDGVPVDQYNRTSMKRGVYIQRTGNQIRKITIP